jgi:hypothetical protein
VVGVGEGEGEGGKPYLIYPINSLNSVILFML